MIDNDIQHLHELLAEFRTAMLVTRTASGHLRARPMAIANVEKGSVEVCFATSLSSEKIAEITANRHVLITLQDTSRYITLSGAAEVVQDRKVIHALWSEAWRVWYPKGKDDPELVVLKIVPVDGEYWDMSGTTGIRYLFEAASAYFRGERPEPVEGLHSVVKPNANSPA